MVTVADCPGGNIPGEVCARRDGGHTCGGDDGGPAVADRDGDGTWDELYIIGLSGTLILSKRKCLQEVLFS